MRNETLIKSKTAQPVLSDWAQKLVTVKNINPRIAILTKGAEDQNEIGAWYLAINQYGQIALKYPGDTTAGISILIVPSANLTADSFLGSNPRDLDLSRWWLTRTKGEKKLPTIYAGRSGLIFADARSTSTCIALKSKGYIPLFKPDNTVRGANSKADHFVNSANCFAIRRFCVPEGAEILYTTPISVMGSSGLTTEEWVVGFKIDNNIILLFNPEQLYHSEERIFFQDTLCRFGSETLLESIYSLLTSPEL